MMGARSAFWKAYIEKEASRLFTTGGEAMGSFYIGGSSDLEHNKLPEDLSDSLKAGHSLFVARQESTWKPFTVSAESFEEIVQQYKIPEAFTGVLHPFGSKILDSYQYRWSDCYLQGPGNQRIGADIQYEFCYRIQHVAPNGRSRGDSYSTRQTGVYQRLSISIDQSQWVLLQPSPEIEEELRQLRFDCNSNLVMQSISIHHIILDSSLSHWDEYLETLRVRLDSFNEKAWYSKVGRKAHTQNSDYSVSFVDCQTIQHLLSKLRYLSSALEANLAVFHKWEFLCKTLLPESEATLHLLCESLYRERTVFYMNTVSRLIAQGQETSNLLSKINDFRNSQILHHTSVSMSENLLLMKKQSLTLNEISGQGASDSRSVKALTYIATLYLPASLVATIFSSNLVQAQDTDQNHHLTHFVIAPQAWVFVIITLPLMAFTFSAIRFLEWVWSKKEKN